MAHLRIQPRDFPLDLHTDAANNLAHEQVEGKIGLMEYHGRTLPVMVGFQSQGRAVEYLPVIMGLAESFGALTRDLIGMSIGRSMDDDNKHKVRQEEAMLRIKWSRSGSETFGGQDTFLLSSKNLEPALRLMKQRQGIDMILLDLTGPPSTPPPVGPSGVQKGSKREGRKGEEAATGRHQWHSDCSDYTMEGSTAPGNYTLDSPSMMQRGPQQSSELGDATKQYSEPWSGEGIWQPDGAW